MKREEEVVVQSPVKRQDLFEMKDFKELKFMGYYPCFLESISADKTRVIIRYGKWMWEAPATCINIGLN